MGLASETQVSGDHYKNMAMQPMEYSMANSFNACQHTAIKYIGRYNVIGGRGVIDIDKAIHTLELLKEIEYGYGTDVCAHCELSGGLHKSWCKVGP